MASGAARDLGLQRVGTSTRFLAVGALVAGGVLSAAVAKALPGKSNHPAAPLGDQYGKPDANDPCAFHSLGRRQRRHRPCAHRPLSGPPAGNSAAGGLLRGVVSLR